MPLSTLYYDTPILVILLEADGSLPRSRVLPRLEMRLRRLLTDEDYSSRPPPNENQAIWVHHTDSARQRLVKNGWVSSPDRGIWALTPKGHREAMRRRVKGKMIHLG